MVSKVTIGDIRGLLMDSDKRPVLRLLPEMDEVCRGYALAHLGDIEAIASQVWVLNVTDWIRGQKIISFNLCKTLDDSGLGRELHEFALKITEDLLRPHEKQGGQVFKESWKLLEVKRRWIKGEVSDEELREARAASSSAYSATYGAASRPGYSAARSADRAADTAVYWAGSRTASWAASWATYWAADTAAERKKQVELLGDTMEDTVGIERGFKGENLESKVSKGGQ